jgi:hypothetical protein
LILTGQRRRRLRELQEFFAPMAAFPLQLTPKRLLVDEEIMTTPGHLENFAPPPYRRGHDHNSVRLRFPALVPLICTLYARAPG